MGFSQTDTSKHLGGEIVYANTFYLAVTLNQFSSKLVRVYFNKRGIEEYTIVDLGSDRYKNRFGVFLFKIAYLLWAIVSSRLSKNVKLLVPHDKFICRYFIKFVRYSELIVVDDGSTFLEPSLKKAITTMNPSQYIVAEYSGWISSGKEIFIISRSEVIDMFARDTITINDIDIVNNFNCFFIDDGVVAENALGEIINKLQKKFPSRAIFVAYHPRRTLSQGGFLGLPLECYLNHFTDGSVFVGINSTFLVNMGSLPGEKAYFLSGYCDLDFGYLQNLNYELLDI